MKLEVSKDGAEPKYWMPTMLLRLSIIPVPNRQQEWMLKKTKNTGK